MDGRIEFRCAEAEKHVWEELARRAGFDGLSAFIRHLLREAKSPKA